jgi:hypothetical protein
MAVAHGNANLGQPATHCSRIYAEHLANGGEGISSLIQTSGPKDVVRGEPGMASWDALPAHVLENSLSGDAVAFGEFHDLDT